MSAMIKPMTGAEYDKALDRLGLSNRFFCQHIIGVEDKTGRNWKSEASPVPGAVAALLRMAVKLKLSAERLAELVG